MFMLEGGCWFIRLFRKFEFMLISVVGVYMGSLGIKVLEEVKS